MKVQKLNWAGIKLECNQKTILIDAVENFDRYFPVLGTPMTPLINLPEDLKVDYILLTHLHLDHFDSELIAKRLSPNGKIIAFKKHENLLNKLNHESVFLEYDEVYEENGIIFKAVFSMDGIGEEQTAWIVGTDSMKIFHGGDTIWHNQFWRLGKENSEIKYAFLPINGAIVNFKIIGLAYSTVPASLTPEQAFNAAKLLNAQTLIPIHYGKFATPFYQPTDTNPNLLSKLSEQIGQEYYLLNDGDYLN